MRIGMRRAFRILFLPLCFGSAFLCVLSITYLSAERSAAILGCSAVGALIAAVCGWKIGRLLEFRVKGQATLRIPLVALGLLLPALAYYLCTHIPDKVSRSLYLLEGAAVILLIAALVATADLLGFLLLPGRTGIPAYRRFRLVIFLYGCLFAGVLTGYLRYPRDRLTVPYPPRSNGNTAEGPARQTLEDLVLPVTEVSGDGGEIIIEIHNSWRQIPPRFYPSPTGTIYAQDGTAVIDGHPLRLVDHLLRPIRLSELGDTLGISVEDGLASNLDEASRPAFSPESPVLYTTPLLDLLLHWPEDLEILPIGTEIVLLPWERPVPAGGRGGFSAGRDKGGKGFLLPAPGIPA